MAIDRFSFLQDRMSRSYQEQVWMVMVSTGVNAFIISQSKVLTAVIQRSTIHISITFFTIVSLLFIWSRHFIYRHYDLLLRDLVAEDHHDTKFFKLTKFKIVCRIIAGWSGILLYSAVLVILAIFSWQVVKNVVPAAA